MHVDVHVSESANRTTQSQSIIRIISHRRTYQILDTMFANTDEHVHIELTLSWMPRLSWVLRPSWMIRLSCWVQLMRHVA